eukprot:6205458-Pleurochrysis_carterae.AAC.5
MRVCGWRKAHRARGYVPLIDTAAACKRKRTALAVARRRRDDGKLGAEYTSCRRRLPELIDGQKRIREGGHAADVAQDKVRAASVSVHGAEGHVPDCRALLRFTVHASDEIRARPTVDEIGQAQMDVPRAAAVDDEIYTGLARRQGAIAFRSVASEAQRPWRSSRAAAKFKAAATTASRLYGNGRVLCCMARHESRTEEAAKSVSVWRARHYCTWSTGPWAR